MGSTSHLFAEVSLAERRSALDAVLKSATFSRNPRLGKLLLYLCSKSFAGESGSLKEYTIATDVFCRPSDFDQSTDAIVRVEMHRLRKKLKDFYQGEGASQAIEIVVQSGHYAPDFVERKVKTEIWVPEPKTEVESATVSEPQTPEPHESIASPAPVLHRFPWIPSAVITAAVALSLLAWIGFSSGSKRKPVTASAAPVTTGSTNLQTPALPDSAAVRILSGRTSEYRDAEGNLWAPDRFYSGGVAAPVLSQIVYRTRSAALFSGGRSGDFNYDIPLKPGVYELHLYFAETGYTPDKTMDGAEMSRTFHVDMNGKVLLRDFDIAADAGANTADERVFKDVHPARDGLLHLAFTRAVGDPTVCAIAILPGIPHRMRPVRISTELTPFSDKAGLWQADDYFLNGRSFLKNGVVEGPLDSRLFKRERFGNFSYAIPATPGTYRLNLYMAETFFGPDGHGGGGVGSRVFDVYCNGTTLLRQFDLFSEAGSRHQLVKSFRGIQPNQQGNVLLSFVPRKNYATVSAIELIDESNQ